MQKVKIINAPENRAYCILGTQKNDEFISNDPGIGHYEQCLSYAGSRIGVEEFVQKTKFDIKKELKRNLEAFISICERVIHLRD